MYSGKWSNSSGKLILGREKLNDGRRRCISIYIVAICEFCEPLCAETIINQIRDGQSRFLIASHGTVGWLLVLLRSRRSVFVQE